MALLTVNSAFRRVASFVESYLTTLTVLLVVIYAVLQFRTYRFDLRYWDSMLISGLVVLLIGVVLARKCPAKMDQALDRLLHRNALTISPARLARLKKKQEQDANRFSLWTAILVSVALLLGFLVAYRFQLPPNEWVLLLLEMILGFYAGRYIGRMIVYGELARFLRREKVSITVVPGHMDGAAGLKPVGDLFFFQAMVLALPAVYLAIWWIVIPLWPEGFYDHWREAYASLLLLAIAFEVLAFIVPLWFFHREMEQQKQQLLITADELSIEISMIENQLAAAEISEERDALNERLDSMKRHYWQIEQMPTWPVDVKTRKQFRLSNMGLLVPVFAQLISASNPWQRVLRAAEAFFQNLPE